MARPGGAAQDDWWRTAVIHQVYLRSFADGNGDGVGDLPGLRARLPYLADLGVDAIWITPWYRSPMADGGYDVADYRDIDPLFGTLADAQAVIDDAHALGLRVIVDIVPNHTSDQHAWFRAAVERGRGSAARRRYLFRDGRGPGGDLPPNDWPAAFGGPAWTRITEPDGTPGQWYLHLFAPEQPDLDWTQPSVHADFDETLRFWFGRGVDGFRIDVAMSLVKAPGLPDAGPDGWVRAGSGGYARPDHPFLDREEVHEVWRAWRAIADSYDPPRVFVGEVAVLPPDRLARYVRPDELHSAFNFDVLKCPWDAARLRATIDTTMAALGRVGAPATWVLSNHDEPRHLTRFGWPETGWRDPLMTLQGDPDLALGERRARAAALLTLGLPGGAYLYQGEELGLEQVLDIPDHLLQDPTWERSGHTARGRDGCRVPIPWGGDAPPFGFSPEGVTPWLPQPASWVAKTVTAESADPGSMLWLYRSALAIRRAEAGFTSADFRWLDSPDGTLLFARGDGIHVAVNLSASSLPLPAARTTLLRSTGPADGPLPPDSAEWFRP
ncbi:MAG: glycoside hydrolase family 13 protein [Chloroflexota bacterium]